MNHPKDFSELRHDMENGFQSSGVSFWQHGKQVVSRFNDLMLPNPKMDWTFPAWFTDNADWIRSKLLPEAFKLSTYQLWHDCGKPYCRVIDEAGKVHYPDHANVSADIWLKLGGNAEIAELMRRDMDCHILKPADALEFAQTDHALSLLVTALCETHANAPMWHLDSFKIKMKKLTKCGNTILGHLKMNNS